RERCPRPSSPKTGFGFARNPGGTRPPIFYERNLITMQISTSRYAMEWQLMRNTFPEFRAFARPPQFGWEGFLQGKKSGLVYGVTLISTENTYPAYRPKVFITPRFGGN